MSSTIISGRKAPTSTPIAPHTFTDRHQTPWGAAINFDGEHAGPVREFFIHNALYWIEEFHLDGLRLDAVHAILDDSPTHLLEELAERVRAAAPERPVHLVLENEENQAQPAGARARTAARAGTRRNGTTTSTTCCMWRPPARRRATTPTMPATRTAGPRPCRGLRVPGRGRCPIAAMRAASPSAGLPPTAFVAFIQNHDQVGNRAFGDR